MPSTKPCPKPMPSTTPMPSTKPCPKPMPSTAPAPSIKPSTKPCPKSTSGATIKKGEKKPFMLDHFKMIVNALKKLGVEEKEIVTYIKEGKKLEEILNEEHIKPKKFKKCILKEYNKVVDEAQKNGQITCEQAKQLKAAIKETIKNWLPTK